jgi:hypothetical protein
MPQDLPMGHQQQDLIQYLTTISKIEQDTGIAFFPDLPAETRTELESDAETRLW